MAKEQTKVGTNPLKLPFPQDQQGALSDLKRGGIKAVSRVKGNPAKQEALLKTLAVIAAYSKEKYAVEQAAREKARSDAVSARARIEAKLKRQAEDRVAELEKATAAIKSAYGLDGKPVEAEVKDEVVDPSAGAATEAKE